MYERIAATLVIALALILTNARGGDSSPSPQDLISKAVGQQDIWAKDMPPMKIRAEVTLQPEHAPATTGAYQLDWISQSRWREELRFANYFRGRIGITGGYLQKSDIDYLPYFALEFDDMIHLADVASLHGKESFGKMHRREKDGIRQICVDVVHESLVKKTLCYDDKTRGLVSIDYHAFEHRHAPYVSRVEYSDFRPYQGKLLPFETRALHGGQSFVSFKIVEIGNPPGPDSTIYNNKSDWAFWSHCDGMNVELKLKPHIAYPPEPYLRREAGEVAFYVVVEADGSVSHPKVIRGASEALDQAAAYSIRQWIYTPAVCDGKPVRSELGVLVDFWFRD
jgi:TonB family protein